MDRAWPLAEEDGQSRGRKVFSSFLLLCTSFHKKWEKILGFRQWTTCCSNFAPIRVFLIIFQNYHEWTETWINIVKIVLLINRLTGLTRSLHSWTTMLELHLEARTAIWAHHWHKLCQSFIYCVSAKNTTGRHVRAPHAHGASEAASRECWQPGVCRHHIPSRGQDTL